MVASTFSTIVGAMAIVLGNDRFGGSPTLPSRDWPCGATAIFVAARLSDFPVRTREIENAIPIDADRAMSLLELERYAKSLGIYTLRTKVISFSAANFTHPMIVRLRLNDEGHFVVLYGADHRGVQVLDFPYGPKFIAPQKLREIWEGHALIVPRRSVVPVLKAREARIQWMNAATRIILVTTLCLYLFGAKWSNPKKLVIP